MSQESKGSRSIRALSARLDAVVARHPALATFLAALVIAALIFSFSTITYQDCDDIFLLLMCKGVGLTRQPEIMKRPYERHPHVHFDDVVFVVPESPVVQRDESRHDLPFPVGITSRGPSSGGTSEFQDGSPSHHECHVRVLLQHDPVDHDCVIGRDVGILPPLCRVPR